MVQHFPHLGNIVQVAGFAVDHRKGGKTSQHPQVAEQRKKGKRIFKIFAADVFKTVEKIVFDLPDDFRRGRSAVGGQQTHDVVSERSPHGVLKIDDRAFFRVRRQHDVVDVIVPQHQPVRYPVGQFRQPVGNGEKFRGGPFGQRLSGGHREIPVGKQAQVIKDFAAGKLVDALRTFAHGGNFGGGASGHAVKAHFVVVCQQFGYGVVAQVFQQQKAVAEVFVFYFGDIDAAGAEKGGKFDKFAGAAAAAFVVHDYRAAAVVKTHAVIFAA